MSLGLLTALLLVGQTAKPAELPIDPNVTCTAEQGEECLAILNIFPETLDVIPAETEEAEPEVCGRSEPLPCRKPEPVEARVAELLEACQRAIADGKRDEAQSLVYQAMLLDPAGIAVNALAERVREMEQPGNSAEESKEEPCEDPGSAQVDPVTAPEETLQPALPPVDPGIVNALEKVLRESGEPTAPKLVVSMEEPQEDEPEEPVSEWRPGVPEVEIPSLADSEEEDSSLEDPETGEETPPADLDEMPRAELEQLLREACEAIERGDYVKVSQPPRSLAVRIGGVQCAMIVDNWGHRYLIVKLTAEASGDLRLMQAAHNERVLDWIIAHNSGGNLQESAEEPAADEELDRLREDIEDPEPEEDGTDACLEQLGDRLGVV